jgi:hypothetical protein
MKRVDVVIMALCCLTLATCSKDSPIQTGTDLPRTQYPMAKKLVPPPIPPVEGIWGPCWTHAYSLHASFPYFSSEVARLSSDFDRDTLSANLTAWIEVGQNAGFTFFLYQFPDDWIREIGTLSGRRWIANRIQAVHAVLSTGQSCAVEIDDLDNTSYGYTANRLDSLRTIIHSLNYNDPIYGTVASNCSLLDHVDVIMADPYRSQNRTSLYQQLKQTYQKPLKVWISIEQGEWFAQDACAIRDQIEDAKVYATSLWVFADYRGVGYPDLATDGQFNLFLSALEMSRRCP